MPVHTFVIGIAKNRHTPVTAPPQFPPSLKQPKEGTMISVRDLSKTFPGSATRALDTVNCHIERGEMVALIGSSGSGKSTLLRHMAGLTIGDRNAGQVCMGGESVQENGRIAPHVRRLRRSIGVVFQQFNLVGRLSVHTNVLLGALGRTPLWRTLLRSFSLSDRRLALEALHRVGIGDKAWQRASTLSGGQQQRAAIARALVQQAEVLLADEPIASLDPESSRNIMETLADLNRRDQITVVVCLHQVDYAIRYCPRTIALRKGKVVYDGPSERLTPAFLKEIYGAETDELFGHAVEAARRPVAFPTPCAA